MADTKLPNTSSFHPSADAVAVHRWRFDTRRPQDALRVRQALRTELGRSALGLRCGYDVELVFAELLGNVIRHAPGAAEAVLERSDRRLVLHMRDRGPGFTLTVPHAPDLFSESGRGLLIVAAFADDLTVERRPRGGSHARAAFTFGQPATRVRAARAAAAPADAGASQGSAA